MPNFYALHNLIQITQKLIYLFMVISVGIEKDSEAADTAIHTKYRSN